MQHAAGHEAVDRLAGGEPQLAHPGGALEHAAFHRGDRGRAVHALVLEQVTQILACKQTHPGRARIAAYRQLEVDHRRAAVVLHQPVGFLGQIVVRHPAAVQLLQQPARAAEVGQIAARRALVHRIAGQIAAIQMASVPVQQTRCPRQAIELAQGQGFAPRQPPGHTAQQPRRRAQVAPHEQAIGVADQQDAPEGIGLQR
ncbi:hypothetical protein LMG19146_00892 [Xanthomonas arboricola pv. fragariae]|nr:hypothetical protein LMG19146_00892 [Xanthomonas arboricola pv. fragariae]